VLVLDSRLRLLLFLLVVAAPALVLMAKTLRVTLAQTWGDSLELNSIQRAIALDRGNPQLHYTLGTVYLFGGETTPPALAVEEMRQATVIRPNSARFWSGLGKACWMAGDQDCADQAFARAVALAPSSPQYVWDAAVNAAGMRRRGPAISQLQNFLRLQPEGYPQAFQLLWRAFGDSGLLWNDLLQPSAGADVKLACLEFLGENGRFDLAAEYWAELAAAHPALSFAAAEPYLEELISNAHYPEAVELWRYLRQSGAVADSPGADPANLVFNGGFEQAPLQAGFDWRYQPQPYINVNFADPAAHRGARALRVDFTVPRNSEFEPVQELAPVAPGKTYVLSAYVRSEAITSDSGPRLRVVDPQCPACLDVATEAVTGTTNWHEIHVPFTAGPANSIVRISVWRLRSRSFPMEISGSAWFDDVALREAP